jgi:hypothetical protein
MIEVGLSQFGGAKLLPCSRGLLALTAALLSRFALQTTAACSVCRRQAGTI